MAPAALLRSMGGYDASLSCCEDFDLWLRLLSQGNEVNWVKLPLYLYHDNPAGLSKRYRDMSEHELKIVQKNIASGQFCAPESFRAGTVLATWLLRHLLRAQMHADPEYQEWTQSNLQALLAVRWPLLAVAIRIAAASGLHRAVYPRS